MGGGGWGGELAKPRDLCGVDSGNRHDGRVESADIHGISEGEQAGMEEPQISTLHCGVTERLEQALLHVRRTEAGCCAELNYEVEGNIEGRQDLEVVTCKAPAIEIGDDFVRE